MRQCEALEAITPDQLPAVASEDGARAFFAEFGGDPAAAADAARYARSVQIEERAVTVRRDVAQTVVGRNMCNRLGEVVSLVDANNEGPEN